ncbi:34487_t:CDS:2 [Gigaspora margarita]|uniref:34487_t:CDS:1 n=1 Tax=Gigaspora margarita TaxID=4874 RepID=A0ABN7U8I2_GIGMA|nr:34487_t:CDS:2 [Gigaspora margarita]
MRNSFCGLYNFLKKEKSSKSNNYFKNIPQEIMILIMLNLDGYDLIMFSMEWKKTINYAYKPNPYEIENLSTKGWFKFKVPNKIFVHKNSKVKTELRRYTSLEENEISLWIKSMELYSVQLVRCQK